MGLRDKLSSWQEKRLLSRLESDKEFAKQFYSIIIKQNPVGALVAASSHDDTQPPQFDQTSHLKVYLVNVYCFAAMRAIAKDLATTPLLVQRKIKGSWETQDDENKVVKEVSKIFNRPNPDETWYQLSCNWELAHLATGNGYLGHDRKENEFWYIKPDWVKAKTDKMGRIKSYEVENVGQSIDLDFLDVIHLKSANPTGVYYGMPPGETIKQTIIGKLNLDNFLNSVWKNSAMVGLAVSVGPTVDWTQESVRNIVRSEVEKMYVGSGKAGKTFIGSADTKIERLSYPVKDLIPVEINDMVLREICAAYGVPPIKINILDEATYNNAKEQERIYQEGTVESERTLVEAALNVQYIYPKYGDDWRVFYDRSKVLALQENRDEKSTYICNEWKSGLIKLNEARESLGWEAVDELEGGDDFYSNPLLDFGVGDMASDNSGKLLNLDDPRLINARKDANIPRLQKWKALDRQLRNRERKLQSTVSKFFREQLDRLLDKMGDITGDGKMLWRLKFYLKADSIPENWINDLFNIADEDEFLLVALGDVLEQIAKDAGQAAIDGAGIDVQFNVKDPRLQLIIDHMKNKVKGINQTTWEEVRSLISESYQNGDSIAEMSSKLSESFSEFSKTRSRTIARTETNKFSNASSVEGFRQAGIEKKEWLSVQDDKVRESHSIADGQIRGLDEPFDVGGEELFFPGDPIASGGETINCRCQIVMPENV